MNSSAIHGSSPYVQLRVVTLLAAAALFAAPSQPVAAQGHSEAGFVPGRVLVVPRAGLPDSAVEKMAKESGGSRSRRLGNGKLYIVDLPAGAERAVVERLARHPHVKSVELDRLIRADLAVNDPFVGSQWHLAKIGAASAWDASSGAGITIAILDSGVNGSHPDLAARMVPGWNAFENNANTADVYGHGTKVAGAAAATFNNGTGGAGVAGQARIMPVRVTDANGWASLSAVAQGLIWAADNGARVANVSFVVANSASVISAANYMKGKGGLVVTSAGNYGTDAGIAPTTAMIPVSATNGSDVKTSWSSYGSFVALAAPGEGIYTTTSGGGYGSVSGTSFSSPVTAGVVGLMMAARPTLSSASVESLLYQTAVDLGAAGRDALYGHGRVNASAAVNAALTASVTTDTTPPTASIAAPLASSTVAGLVAVDVAASDNVGVARAELWVNGKLLASDSTAPFLFSWDSATAPNGINTLVAKAIDAAGNVGSSSTVSVNVANVSADTVAPRAAFASPGAGATVSGTASVKVNASDNGPIASVRQTLSLGSTVVATATGGALSWNWNTRKYGKGTYTLTARAVDGAGNASSTSILVNIK